MTGRTSLRIASGVLAIFTIAACEEDILDRVPGQPELCLVDAAGEPTLCSRTDQTIDFGPVLIDNRHEIKLLLRNVGRSDMALASSEVAEGDAEHFAIPVTHTGISTGQLVPLTASFSPGVEGELSATINLRITDGTVDTFPVRLTGRGVKGGCVIEPAEVVDFGSVANGDSWTTTVTIRNASDLPWPVTIGGINSDVDAEAFSFDGFEPGEHIVEAHSELEVPITFRPNHLGGHTGFLTIPAPALCQPVLRLQGNGVDQVLTWEPSTVNFGFVNPNTRVTAEVTFKNAGNSPVLIEELSVADTKGKFTLDDPSFTSFVVAPHGGEQKVALAFKPTTLGDERSTLDFKTDSPRLPAGSVSLRGYGGGPDIDVSPRSLSFGQVGIGSWQSRRLVVANVGSDAPATDDDNLKLATTWYRWEPEVGHNFTAVLEKYPTAGIRAGTSFDVQVKFAPLALGVQEAKLKIFSNDPDEPVVEINVSAEGADLPPCDYEIVPPTVRFGYVEPGRFMTMSFFIRNPSSNTCLVSTLDLPVPPGSPFSLPKPINLPVTIAPGESFEVPVRYSPTNEGEHQAQAEFFINSLTSPQGLVPISGTSKGGCILVAPNDTDFGVNKVNCSARERTFTIYNSCGAAVTVNSLDVQAGISNEFRITNRPALPHPLPAGSSVEFKATYRPTDVGQDVGTIAVQTAQLPHPYVVAVSGRGAVEAIQTDVYAQDAKPKMDILFVIDDSCSMTDKQALLGANFDAFMTYAEAQQVDYHIAVTTSSTGCGDPGSSTWGSSPCWDSKGRDGRFVPASPLDVPDPGKRVITPETPNAKQLFASNVYVEDLGSGWENPLEAAMLALGQNRLTGHNSGFLRPDAYLAIVIVTDTFDQSPGTVPFYYNYFLNVVGFRRANEFSISGIIPTSAGETSNCSYDEPTSAIQSTRLRDIINRSGGLFDNICTPNWSKTLEEIGRRIFGYKTRFFLNNAPDLSPGADPLTVYINDAEYPSRGPGGDVRWTYDSVNNSINFDPLTAPEPGDTVRIVYSVACLP